MASIFELSPAELLQAKEFLRGLLAAHPDTQDIDTSDGSGMTDLVIKIWSVFYAYFKLAVTDVRLRQSLLRVNELDDTDKSEAVQELLSNWFLTLKTGDKSQGKARIVASQPFDYNFTDPTKYSFVRQGDIEFRPLEPTVINSQIEGTFVEEQDINGEVEYVFELNLIAVSAGSEYDIEPGLFEFYPKVSPYIKRVENSRKFSGGKGDETIDELQQRGPLAVSTRDLVSEPAIQTIILDTFSQVKYVSVVGAGDPEMQRDLKNVALVAGVTQPIHMLGYVDAYCAFELSKNSSLVDEVIVNQTSKGPITGIKFPQVPIFALRRVYNRSRAREMVNQEFDRVSTDFNLTNSSQQDVYLRVPDTFIGDTIEIIYDTALGFDAVDAFVISRANRNLTANTLVKACFPIYPFFEVKYSIGSELPDINEGLFKNALITFFKTLDPAVPINISNVTTYIKQAFPEITYVAQPLVMNGDFYRPDGTVARAWAQNKFGVSSLVNYDIGYSQRTVAYYLIEENITITRV